MCTELFKRITAFTALFIYTCSHIMAQTGVAKGSVRTADGKPAANVTIALKGTNRGGVTDDLGGFEIRKLATGNYILVISHIGLKTKETPVAIRSGQTSVVPEITLDENLEELKAVEIKSGKARQFTKTTSEYLAKLPLKDLENSQSYTTVTGELMQEQMVTNLSGAIQNVPGVSPLFMGLFMGGGNVGSYYTSRGFSLSPTLRNGVSTAGISDPDPANIQEVETLKGPAGTLFGSSLVSWGGLINLVTKQPYGNFGGEAGYTAGGFGLSRFTADLNIPLNRDTTLLFRVNAAHTYQGSFQDAGFTKSNFFAPTLTYKPNDRLTISLEGQFYERQGTTPTNIFIFYPMNISSPAGLNLAYSRSFTNNQMISTSSVIDFFGQVRYKLSDHWTSQTVLSNSVGKSDGPIQWEYFTTGNGDSLLRNITDNSETITTTELQQNFISDYSWGQVRNRLVIGVDFYYYNNNNSYYYVPFDTLNVSNPGMEYLNLTPGALSAKEATGQYGPAVNIDNEYTYATYVSDVFNLTDNLIANAGLRVDHFDERGNIYVPSLSASGAYKQTTWSPKFGLIYQPVKNRVALFVNYLNGFENNSGADFYGKPFKPSYGNQLETGVKLDIWEHRISATLSYYDIHASNLLETDPNHPQFSIQDGTETSKGAEISINANPFPGFNLIAGYSYNHAIYGQNDFGMFGPLPGLRPSEAGPANTANVYASYHVLSGKAKGLGIGFGLNYASANTDLNEEPDGAGVFILPAYTVINASAFYDTPRFRFGFKVSNLTNRQYWIGWYSMEPQMPRNLSANLTIKI